MQNGVRTKKVEHNAGRENNIEEAGPRLGTSMGLMFRENCGGIVTVGFSVLF